MKKQILIAALGCMAGFCSLSAQNKPSWIQGVALDGKVDEWKGAMRFYDKTAKMKYGFANDDKYLYLAFQVIEPDGQIKIMRGGLNIYLKTKVKPKYIGTLKLNGQKPDRQMMEQQMGERPKQQQQQQQEFAQMGEQDQQKGGQQGQGKRGPNTDMMKQLYLLTKPTIETEGFAESNEMIVAGENGQIAFQVGWNDQNQMNIECRIPLKELFGAKYDLDKISAKDIALIINQTQQEQMQGGPGGEGGPQGGGMPGGGPGGPGGGGMQGGPGGGGPEGGMGGSRGGEMSQNRSAMFEKISIKNSIILAVKPE